MTQPLISVVIAAYHADHYLVEALQDACQQTYTNLEILVSDDAASSDTRELVTRQGDPRIRYHANSPNLGPAMNHWKGIQLAQGEFIAILNHDDRWQPNFLERLSQPLMHDSELTFSFCDHQIIRTDGSVDTQKTEVNSLHWGRDQLSPGRQSDVTGLVVRQSIPVAMGCLFRKTCLENATWPEDIGPAYDLWLAYLLAIAGGAGDYIPDRLSSWREHPGNLTSAGELRWSLGSAFCWEAMRTHPMFRQYHREVKARLASAYRSAANAALHNGDRPHAHALARKAWLTCPTSYRSAALALWTALPASLTAKRRRIR